MHLPGSVLSSTFFCDLVVKMSSVHSAVKDSPLVDLNHLTDEERIKIEKVLEEDRKIMIEDRIRLG